MLWWNSASPDAKLIILTPMSLIQSEADELMFTWPTHIQSSLRKLMDLVHTVILSGMKLMGLGSHKVP